VTGNLETEAQERYAFVEGLLRRDFAPPARVVELGSAPGDQIAQLARRGYDATSVDIGEAADEWGNGEEGRMDRLLAEAGVDNVRWNLEEAPYPLADASFDAVIMTEVYEHLREYPVRSLQETARILKPGGRLYFTTPNAAYLMNRLRLLRGENIVTPLPDWIAGVPYARHAREYTFGEIDELMAYAGLRVHERHSRHFHLASGNSGAVAAVAKSALHRVAAWRPTLGPAIIVVAGRDSPADDRA